MSNIDIKTAVIGVDGFLGAAFYSFYRRRSMDIIGTSYKGPSGGLMSLDMRRPEIAPLKLSKKGYRDALILAARSNIGDCEKNRDETRLVNVTGTLELVRQLVKEGVRPVFFSSDHVFDGEKGGYSDNAATNPVTEYGRQKAEVEAELPGICGKEYLIVRLSKVFGLMKNDGTLLDEMADIFAGGGEVMAAFDQIFSPTFVLDVVGNVTLLQRSGLTGAVNVCPREAWSRYDLAIKLAALMGIPAHKVRKVAMEEVYKGQVRPKNTSMVPERLGREDGASFKPMKECLNVVAENWNDADIIRNN